MNQDLEKLRSEALAAVGAAGDLAALDAAETRYLGRKGSLAEFLRNLGTISAEGRKDAGKQGNALKLELEAEFSKRRAEFGAAAAGAIAEKEWIDVTAPGVAAPRGHLHPMTRTIRDIESIFTRLGYNRTRYPEVEWDWYAFEAMNMPKDHPARDEWETFFVLDSEGSGVRSDEKLGKCVLTPHTSSGQVREMQRGELPIRMVNISKCYRRQMDVTHTPMFHQFEGLLVDKGVSIAHLKGTLDHFAASFFGAGRRTRLRPYHFRFTEPSFEIDVSCGVCGGTGKVGAGRCRLCKEGWLELGGAGMVHPNVLKAGGVDPEEWGGFAFGWGVERVWMMKHGTGIADIRPLYQGDVRFLEQF